VNQIINYVSDFFGIIMRWCYVFVNNYGLSIIVFTIFTKFVLFPISLITQKNSIKMAQMRPELDALKVKYVDDKDRYADAQLELYKKMQYHPLLDMIPLLIQILIVLGLVGVMYCPLSYILRIQDPDIAMLQKWFEGLGWTLQDNSYQLTMIHEIQNGISGVPENLMGLIEKISDFDMNFIGFNLSEKPQLSLHNKLVLIPVLSGVSAWLMCVVQNKINVLQLYAGKWNKIGMTVFMIAFSTYFAFLVPAGVGVYWIFGNLFAIPSMYLVNIVMPPEKYIDMDYIRILNETAEEKEKIRKKYGRTEKQDYHRFEKAEKRIVFYAEGRGFYKYYQPIIEYLAERSDYKMDYVTSDPEDPILKQEQSAVRAYYIAQDKYLIPLFMKLDCDICLMTMPDLEKYHIKRSKVRSDIEYIYVAHGMGSNALTLRKGALDYYDTVFCVGIDSVREIQQMEALYVTQPKTLVETGYALLDQMIEQYQIENRKENEKKKILIAPSWQPENIIDLCIEQILDKYKNTPYEVIVRPHPQQVRHQMERFVEMQERYAKDDNITIQTDFSSNSTVMDADLLITDWSDISFEYAFTTLKPVLFIDTPMKIMNPEYDKIEQKPINVTLRNVLGKAISVNDIDNILEISTDMLKQKDMYRKQIADAREKHIFNIGKSRILSGKYIMKRLME